MQLPPALTHRTLAGIGEMSVRVREDLRIVEEQLLFQMDVVEENKTRALVAETPLAHREFEEAQGDLQRMEKARAEAQRVISELQAEQDRLLDRMLG